MLVLSRRLNESIVIGDNVKITVLEVRGDVVRIGIDAPRSVVIHRQEVHDALIAANASASKLGNVDVGKLPKPPAPPSAES